MRARQQGNEVQDLTDDALTGSIRVWQRRHGHRYSLDDVATAWFALRAQQQAASVLDLGCGLGSVLLMAADRLPQAQLWGIEAQTMSYELAVKNVERNALSARVSVRLGDLRDSALLDDLKQEATGGGGFALVTGTPPYKLPGTATPSSDSQRAYARIELRGGIPEYLHAAVRVLAQGGLCVLCAEAGAEPRIAAACEQTGLRWLTRMDVVPMAGRKRRLLAVHAFAHAQAAGTWLARICLAHPALSAVTGPNPVALAPLIARDEHGARTEQAHELRRFFGLSPQANEPASPPTRVRRAAG